MSNKSTLEVAFELIQAKEGSYEFIKLWDEVSLKLGLSNEQKIAMMSKFYTNITLDGRFVNLGNNKWDLTHRLRSDQIETLKPSNVYSEVDEEDNDPEEKVLLAKDGEVILEPTSSDDKEEDDFDNKDEEI